MIRFLNVTEGKNLPVRKAGAALKRGAPVSVDHTDDTVDPATAVSGFMLVDVAPNYDGINAVIAPNDASFESIAKDALVITVPTYFGERYATTELTIGSLTKGDPLKASAGKFVAAAAADVVEWVYGGTYSDPTGLTMYVVEKVAPYTVPSAG